MLGWLGKWAGSKGMGRIPDLEGLSLNDARQAIIDAGFNLGVENSLGNAQGATSSNNGKAKGRPDTNGLLDYESVLDFEYYIYTVAPTPVDPPFFPPYFQTGPVTPAPTTPTPTTPTPTTPTPTTPTPTTPTPTTPTPTPAPTNKAYATFCSSGVPTTVGVGLNFTDCGSLEAWVLANYVDVTNFACQVGSIPAEPSCVSPTPAPTTPTPTTPTPTPTGWWATGCCDGVQLTGVGSTEQMAFVDLDSQCNSGNLTSVQTGTGIVPSLSCVSPTPTPTTPTPTPAPTPAPSVNNKAYATFCSNGTASSAGNLQFTDCGSLESFVLANYDNVTNFSCQIGSYPALPTCTSTPAPTTPAPTTPAPTTPAPTTPAPTTPAPTTPAPTTPTPTSCCTGLTQLGVGTDANAWCAANEGSGYTWSQVCTEGNKICGTCVPPAPVAPPFFPFFPPFFPTFTPAPATPAPTVAPATPAPATPAPATPAPTAAPATPAPATPAPVGCDCFCQGTCV